MKRALPYLGCLALLALLWLLGWKLWGDNIIPHPLATILELAEEGLSGKLWPHIAASVLRLLGGMAVAAVIGIPLGLAMGSSKHLDSWVKPLLYLTYPLPKIVFLPLLLVLFGIGDSSKIAILALVLFFHLVVTTRDAALRIPGSAYLSLRSLGASSFDLVRHLIWPACLPAVFTSLRIATGTVIAVLFFAETIATSQGLGYYIYDAWGRADMTQMYAGIIVLSIIGVLLYETFDLLERWFCRWQRVQ